MQMIEIAKGVHVNPAQIVMVWRGDVGERKRVMHISMSNQTIYWVEKEYETYLWHRLGCPSI